MNSNRLYQEVLDLVRREKVCLFVGSGCSLDSGAPSASALGKMILSHIPSPLCEEVKDESLMKVSEAFLLSVNDAKSKLNDLVCGIFKNLEPNDFHRTLSKIPQIRTIVTTNYDELIEKAYKQEYLRVICNNEELHRYSPNAVNLFKIHGDCKHLEGLVISESDYREFLDGHAHNILWNSVLNELATKHIVFVGYSLEDWNILNLIDKIRKNITPKQMYLVSPCLTHMQMSRLQKYSVNFIQADGQGFLNQVLSDLKDSFGDDAYSNITSNDTLSRFARINAVIPTFENDGTHTRLKDYRSANYLPITTKLNFSTTDHNILARREPFVFDELLDGFKLPAIRLTESEIDSFEILVNGLKINSKNEVKEVVLAPVVDNLSMRFVSQSKGINIKTNVKKYCCGDKIVCCFNADFYKTEFVFDVRSNPLSLQIETRVNESFTDIDESIKWINLLIDIVEVSDLHVYVENIDLGNISRARDHEIVKEYKEWLAYCENLKTIEKSGFLFDKYEGFSRRSYNASKIVKSYLTHTVFVDLPNDQNRKWTCNIPKKHGFSADSHYVMRTVSELPEPVILCGQSFYVPMERLLMLKCKITLVDDSNGEYDVWEVENLTNEVQYEYCDRDKPDNLIKGCIKQIT